MTRIAYVGNFMESWSTESHVAAAFEALGFSVTFVQHARTLNDRRLAQVVAHERPEFVVYAPGANALSPYGLRDCGAPTVAYHLDRFWGLRREADLRSDPMFRAHVVCTPDGDLHPWAEHDVNHVTVRAAVHGPEAYDADPDAKYDGALVGFVGTGDGYHSEWPHRRALLAQLRGWYGDSFVHLPGREGRIHGDALNRFYASVPIIIGDSCFASAAARYWSDRPYEVWGRGGFLIMPRIYKLSEEIGSYPGFTPYQWDALHDLIDSLLHRPALREDIRLRIAGKVRADCTYRQRVLELVDALARYGERAA